MTIYTKRGDKGKTSLYLRSQEKISKNSLSIRGVGAIDELNSYLGVVCSISENAEVVNDLKEVQKNLLRIGSILAGSRLRFFKTKTRNLERKIDKLEKKLPKLKKFIYPKGSHLATHLHYARALARRAEREVIALNKVKPQIISYLNRLSDYLFMLARDANFRVGIKEETWVGGKK